jgi:hypothetical protein
MLFKQLEIAEINTIPVRNDFLPMLPLWFLHRCPHQTKVFRMIVGTDQEPIVEMIDVIFMLALARQKDFRLTERTIGFEIAVFLAVGVRGDDHQKLL